MDALDYNPRPHLAQIFGDPSSLDDIPQLLSHINQHKYQLDQQISHEISTFNNRSPQVSSSDIEKLIQSIGDTQAKSETIKNSISDITSEISKLDNLKKNLTLSMNIFKRLQILNYSISELNQLLQQSYNYKEIYSHLNNIKDLLSFFKPYKSIDEINRMYLVINKIELRLIDNIFIDFEESIVNNNEVDNLDYSCMILELIDSKYKDKLLNWFYNVQLKDIKSIFSTHDEAGSLDNLSRRFMYFNNTLASVRSKYLKVFPQEWVIDLELSKLFCELTKEDIYARLNQRKISSESLLSCLNVTLEFENNLNSQFNTQYFTKIISKVFEPYLNIWIGEQDRSLNLKIIEFNSTPKIPPEFQTTNDHKEFLNILKINSIPNISNSSIELFKLYQKTLIQILKLSNGRILVDLANLYNKYLVEYHNRVLLPILNADLGGEVTTIESIKYLTMLLNTGDYIINNLDDLFEKFNSIIDPHHKDKFSFENLKNLYLSLINRSTQRLTELVADDLKFSWRQFENNNWLNMDSTSMISNYMIDFKDSLLKNCQIILPLIIRESYVKNFCNKLVESIVKDFANNLKLIKPLSILNIEQITGDLKSLKRFLVNLPQHSNPNFNDKEKDDAEDTQDKSSQFYVKFVNGQFDKLDTLLKLLTTPTLPVDNIVGNYFQYIGDKSVKNFKKILSLKNLTVLEQRKYIENFNLQLTLVNSDLANESPIMALLDDEMTISTSTSPPPLEETKSPKIKINNIEKNLRELALNSENNINKFNENFKNFGKFFRKDNSNQE